MRNFIIWWFISKDTFLERSYSFFGCFGTFLMLSPSGKQLLALKRARPPTHKHTIALLAVDVLNG